MSAHRLAIVLWLLFGLVIWHIIFDSYIRAGVAEYLRRQARYEQRLGPRPDIDTVIDEAIARGLRAATGWSVAVTAAGLLAVRYARHREPGKMRKTATTL